jgi:hypothetical protein
VSGPGDVGLAPIERGYAALRSSEWAEMERRNSEAMVAFQAALAARNGGGYADAPQVAGEAPEPAPTLLEAKAAHAAAVARVARVRDAMARAQDRADANERDLARYSAIDDRIERWVAEQAYADEPSDQLPLSEQLAMAERARAVERHDLASRALRHVTEELRTAEAAEQQTDRQLRAAASAVLMEQAAWLGQELEGVDKHAEDLRARIRAYADANLPGLHGAVALPFAALTALNAPRAETTRDIGREVALREQHAKLMASDA